MGGHLLGGEFLRDPLGLSDAFADAATIGGLAALVVGRWLLSRLTRRWSSDRLLRGAFLVTIAASAPYLLGTRLTAPLDVVVPVTALALLCLTVAMLFPLSLAVTMDASDASDAQQQQASAVAMGLERSAPSRPRVPDGRDRRCDDPDHRIDRAAVGGGHRVGGRRGTAPAAGREAAATL